MARAFSGVSGVVIRSFASREEAHSWLQEQGVKTTSSVPLVRAITDGSVRKGGASAYAALEEGKGYGEAFLPWCGDATEAEARALVLALVLAPRGAVLSVQTDRADFRRFLSSRKGVGKPPQVLVGVQALAEAWGITLRVNRVEGKKVKRAHNMARKTPLKGQVQLERLEQVRDFLKGLPSRYQRLALQLLEAFPGGGKKELLTWLAQGKGATRALLQEILSDMKEEEVKELLSALHSLPRGWQKAP